MSEEILNDIANGVGSQSRASDRARWVASLIERLKAPESPIIVTTFRRSWNSGARPALVMCIDKQNYVIKGQQAGRQIVNDQIVARLGMALGAPVAQPQVVELSAELIELDPDFSYLTLGTAHGTLYLPNCSDDREIVKYIDQIENRARFALLSVLYGWVYARDHQFIYETAYPNRVYSVEHGHFFPGGPNWTETDLQVASEAKVDEYLQSRCRLTDDEIREAIGTLATVTEEKIVEAVASPPEEWGLTMNERETLVDYLTRRKQELLANNIDEI